MTATTDAPALLAVDPLRGVSHAATTAPSARNCYTVVALCGRKVRANGHRDGGSWARDARLAIALPRYDNGVCTRCAERTEDAYEAGSFTWGDGSVTPRARRVMWRDAPRIIVWLSTLRVWSIVPDDKADAGTFVPTTEATR